MAQEMPMMATSAMASQSYSGGGGGEHFEDKMLRRFEMKPAFGQARPADEIERIIKAGMEKQNMTITRRVVRVYISDTNENVPLENCLLFKGDEQLTDANDNELFFEIDVKGLLATHNEKRVKFVDKKVKDRTEYLEPAKVRDLKMTVVVLATL